MSQENVNIVRAVLENFNSGDLDAALPRVDPEIEWHDQPELPGASGQALTTFVAASAHVDPSRSSGQGDREVRKALLRAGDRRFDRDGASALSEQHAVPLPG